MIFFVLFYNYTIVAISRSNKLNYFLCIICFYIIQRIISFTNIFIPSTSELQVKVDNNSLNAYTSYELTPGHTHEYLFIPFGYEHETFQGIKLFNSLLMFIF